MINTIKQALENSFSFADYRKKVTSLIAEGKSTGHTQSEDLLKYSELNETRMNRLEKTIEVTEEVKTKLKNLDKKYIWLVLSEGWCGDAAQIAGGVGVGLSHRPNIAAAPEAPGATGALTYCAGTGRPPRTASA